MWVLWKRQLWKVKDMKLRQTKSIITALLIFGPVSILNAQGVLKLDQQIISITSAKIASDGSVEVTCAESCEIGSGGTGVPPSEMAFTAPLEGAEIAGNVQNPRLTWETNAQFCRGVSVELLGGSGVDARWTDKILEPNGSLALAQQRDSVSDRTYTYTLGCYSAPPDVGYVEMSRTFTLKKSSAGGGSTGDDYCTTAYPGGIVPPSGFGEVIGDFSLLWGVTANSAFPPQSMGNTTAGIAPGPAASKTQYMSIPVDVPSNATLGRGFELSWLENQGGGTSPDKVFVKISPCKGDFRPWTNDPANDPWNTNGCASVAKQKTLKMAAWDPGAPHPGWCPMVRGKRMYINIMTVDVNVTPPLQFCAESAVACESKFSIKQF